MIFNSLKQINFDKVLKTSNEQIGPLKDDQVFLNALENPINSFKINNVGRDQKITIVISDNTRKLPFRKMIKSVLETIGEHKKENVRFLIATGTHKPTDPKTLGIGPDILGKYSFINHDSKNYMQLSYVGEVSSKIGFFSTEIDNNFLRPYYEVARETDRHVFTEAYLKSPEKVFVNKLIVESDILILIGKIKPHYFCGYSGGAKNLVPGCAGRHFILRNHFYKIHSSARLANINNNIVRRELEEAAMLCGNHIFNYNVVMGKDDQLLGCVAGHMIDSHRKGAEICYKKLRKISNVRYDVVLVTDSWPVIMSLKQIKKATSSACRVVKKKGVIIIYGMCNEGLGSDSRLNDKIYLSHLNAIKPEGVDVFIYSSISQPNIELAGFYKYLPSIENGLEYARNKIGSDISICHIPNGSLIIPEIEE